MERLSPLVAADRNKGTGCRIRVCEITCHTARYGGEAAGVIEGPAFGDKCDLCFARQEEPACVAACPEKALRVVWPAAEKRERNIAAARAIKSIHRGGC